MQGIQKTNVFQIPFEIKGTLGAGKGIPFSSVVSCPWIEEGPQAERRWAILGSKVLQKVEREREQGGRATFVCFLFLLLVKSLKLGSDVAVVEASAPSFPRRLGFPSTLC